MKPEERPLKADAALRARAQRAIPGGMYGHNVQRFLFDGAPQFWSRGRGTRIWDVDGNEYIDLMCSWGPVIHGHHHPAVDEAARRQAALLETGNGPSPVFVELAERLLELIGEAEWVVFGKNGTDATTLATRVARAATGRSAVLIADGAFHGTLPWCSPKALGSTPGDSAHVGRFRYNDPASVKEVAQRFDGDVAAVMVTPAKHDAGHDQELVDPDFARWLRRWCTENGTVLILDEVRTGFRIALGSSWEALEVSPDLSCWSKALANGHALAALVGIEALREPASQLSIGGTYWMSAPPMAAALASLDLLEDEGGVEQMKRLGTSLQHGIAERAAHHGIEVRVSGHPAMPYLSFVGDSDSRLAARWAKAVANRGVYLNPTHNWFLSTAHTEHDIQRILDAMDGAFEELASGALRQQRSATGTRPGGRAPRSDL